MKIYIATSGEYSDYHVDAVFSTEEKALEFCATYRGNVEIYEVDELLPRMSMIENRYGLYWVRMLKDGAVINARLLERWFDEEAVVVLIKWDGKLRPSEINGCVWAKDQTHAIKIMNEKRAQAIANNQWPQDTGGAV